MNVLVIGGTGLISTAIVRQLLDRGDRVTLFNRGRSKWHLPHDPAAVRRLTGDRRHYPAFEAQVRDAGRFACVIDMICYTPADAESLVRACRGRTDQLIFCSTVDVYAKPASRYPITEDEPQRPVSTYGQDKSGCETILMAAHQRGDLPLSILRPAQTYGEGRGLIHTFGRAGSFLRRVREGKPLIVHGDGTSLWVACHVDDVARGFLGAMGNERAFGRGYHVTGEEWLTWNRYTELVAEAMGAPPPQIVHIPTDLLARAAPQPAQRCVENLQFPNVFDNTAARSDLGFRYTIPFVEGVRRTVGWLDERGLIDGEEDDPFYDRLIDAWERLGASMAGALAGPAN